MAATTHHQRDIPLAHSASITENDQNPWMVRIACSPVNLATHNSGNEPNENWMVVDTARSKVDIAFSTDTAYSTLHSAHNSGNRSQPWTVETARALGLFSSSTERISKPSMINKVCSSSPHLAHGTGNKRKISAFDDECSSTTDAW